MNLAFSTHWSKEMPAHMAGKPTFFVEKITAQLSKICGEEIDSYVSGICKHLNYTSQTELARKCVEVFPKKHSIRQDYKNRWKVGNKIHFFINNRMPNMFRFAPVMEVKGIQRIEIVKVAPVLTLYTYKVPSKKVYQIIVDGKCLDNIEMKRLALFDGFDSLDDFFEWFKEGFTGKIIHWTNYKY